MARRCRSPRGVVGSRQVTQLAALGRDQRCGQAGTTPKICPSRNIAALLSGADVRYDIGDSHRLSGRLVPDFTLPSGERVAELLHTARPVLLDFTGGTFAESAAPWRGRVDVTTVDGSSGTAAAILIRPDGYVAWAADGCTPGDVDRLRAALGRWFGPARRNAQAAAAG